jgi:competence protein ComEC
MRSPLLALAACFATGIAAARYAAGWLPDLPVLLLLSTLCLLAGLLALRGGGRFSSQVLAWFAFVAAGAAAALLFEARFPPTHISHLESWGFDLRDPVRLTGQLTAQPLRAPYGYQFDLAVEQVEGAGRAYRPQGRVRLRLPVAGEAESVSLAESLDLKYGDRIRVLVQLRRPRVYRNPGSFDFRHWMESIEDIRWVGNIKSVRLIEKLPPGEVPAIGRLVHQVRRRLLAGMDQVYPPWTVEGRYGAVTKAVLLGDRTSLDSELMENFRRTGLYHLLVVSGLHVGLLALIAGLFVRMLPLNLLCRSGLVLGFVLAYILLLEERAPTLRAGLMIMVYLLARFIYREQAALNAIGFAGLALLVLRPAWLYESGFQLSFASVLIIAGVAVPALQRTTEPYRRALWHLDQVDYDASCSPRQTQFRLDLRSMVGAFEKRIPFLTRHPRVGFAIVKAPVWLGLWLANILLFSAFIQLGLLLPMAETFHRVTFAGIGLNALAAPLMTLLLALALPTVILGALLPSMGFWAGKVLALPTKALLMLAELPRLPAWLSYRVPEPPFWVSLGFATSLAALAWTIERRGRAFWVSLGSLGVFATLISLHPFSPRLPKGVMEVTALDCGGGEAIFVVLPDRTTLLVDAGDSPFAWRGDGGFRGRPWDPGESIVSPYLWSRGIEKLDFVVLAHAPKAHLIGLSSIVKNFRVGAFWHPVNPPPPASVDLLAEVDRRGIPRREVAAGDRITLGATQVEILWPPRLEASLRSPFRDNSLVLRLAAGESSVLLPGGISEQAEDELVRSGQRLQATVLQVGLRGSRSPSSANFLAAVRPRAVLLTVPSGSSVGPPSPEILERLRAPDVQVFRTDRDGAVTVRLEGDLLSVRRYRALTGDLAPVVEIGSSGVSPSRVP